MSLTAVVFYYHDNLYRNYQWFVSWTIMSEQRHTAHISKDQRVFYPFLRMIPLNKCQQPLLVSVSQDYYVRIDCTKDKFVIWITRADLA